MPAKIRDVSDIKKELDVVVPLSEVHQELDAAYQRISQRAKIKGFRPGKVPRAVLEQYYKDEAESEALRHLVEHSYPHALQEAGIHPVAPPEIKVTQYNTVSQDLAYTAAVEILPAFEIKGYQGLKLSQDKVDASEEDIQSSLKSLQERMTRLEPILIARPTRADDILVLDYQVSDQRKPVPGFQGKGVLVELGKGHLFPELEAALLGAQPGDKKNVVVQLPEKWGDAKYAGKKVDFEVVVKEMKEKKVPELNDELAKDLGQFSTLNEVKAKIREDIVKNKQQAERNKLRRQVIEKLVEKNSFSLPEGMVQLELEDMLRQFTSHLSSQGMTAEQAGVTREDFFTKNREEAVFRIRGGLIFDALVRKESIQVSPEEIDARVNEIAQSSGQAEASLKKYFHENNLFGRLEGGLREEKALDFVLSHSKIETRG